MDPPEFIAAMNSVGVVMRVTHQFFGLHTPSPKKRQCVALPRRRVHNFRRSTKNLGKNADSTTKKTKIILEATTITDIDFQMCHIKTAVVASISDEYSVSCRAIVEDRRVPRIKFSITW